MRMTTMKYYFLILLANSLMLLVAWGVASANDAVEPERLVELIVEQDLSEK